MSLDCLAQCCGYGSHGPGKQIGTVTITDEEPEIKLPNVTWQISDRTGTQAQV